MPQRIVERITNGAVLGVFLEEVHYISNLTSGIPSVKEADAHKVRQQHLKLQDNRRMSNLHF